MRLRNKGKFYKHIVKNLIFILFVVSILFVCVYYYGEYRHARKSATWSMEYEAEGLSDIMDNRIITSTRILNLLSVTPTVESFLEMEEYTPELALSAYRQFTSLVGLTPDLSITVGVYNRKLDSVLTSAGSFDLAYLLQGYDMEDEAGVKALLEGGSSVHTLFTVSQKGGREYLVFLSEKSLFMESSPFFLIVDKDSLAKGTYIPPELSLSIQATRNVRGEYDFTYPSKIWPITYCYTFERPHQMMTVTSLAKNVLVITLLLFLNIMLTYQAARRLYQPVQNLVVASGDDEGDGVEDEFAHIQRKLDSLKTTIQLNNLSKEDILLKEIIYGIKKDNCMILLEQNHLEYLTGEFFAVIVAAKNPGDEHTYISQTYLEALLKSGLPELDETPVLKTVDVSAVTHVMLACNISRDSLRAALEPMAQEIGSHYFVLTQEIDVTTLSRRFFLMNGYLKYTPIEYSGLLLEEQMDYQATPAYTFTEEDKKFLLYHLNARNSSEYKKRASKLVQENLFVRKLPTGTLQAFLSEVVDFLAPLVPGLNDGSSLCVALMEIQDRTKLGTQLEDLFEDYYTATAATDTQSSLKNRFITYVHEHYDGDISLNDLAEEFNLAGNYVSVLFKEKTGCNFKQYLNTYRIDVSKQIMMENPYIKIKDLAESVGFMNINTFIRTFKVQEGMPPGQYQKYVLENLRQEQA